MCNSRGRLIHNTSSNTSTANTGSTGLVSAANGTRADASKSTAVASEYSWVSSALSPIAWLCTCSDP